MKKKTNSSKKGSNLENLTIVLLRRLSNEFGFRNEKLRRQGSGLQFGKDIIWKFRLINSEKKERYHCVVEDKNYDTELTPQVLGHKLDQAHRSSLDTPIDIFFLFSPKQTVNNDYSEVVDAERSPYSFGVAFWTPDEEIERLVQCFPDIYEQIYGEAAIISASERAETIAFWKDRILEDAAKGATVRLEKTQAKQLSGDKSPVNIDNVAAVELLRKSTEAVLQSSQLRNVTNTSSIPAESSTEKSLISIEIDEALELMESGKIPQALTNFFIILGKVQGKGNLAHELARTYNNIGVAYNRIGQDEDAIQYFRKSLEAEKEFLVPATNLASTFIFQAELSDDHKKKASLLQKAAKIIEPLMTDFGQGLEARVLRAHLRLLKVRDGDQTVIQFITDEAQKYDGIINASSSLTYFLGSLYLGMGDPDKSEEYAGKSITIDGNVEGFILRGRAKMIKALKYDATYRNQDFEDLAPTFTVTTNIESAIEDFHTAIKLAEKKGDKQILSEIKQFEQISTLWLRAENKPESFEFPTENRYVSAVTAFRERKFEISFDLLKQTPDWGQLPPSEVWRLARVYLFNGALEIARELLNSVEHVAEEEKNFQFWMDKSTVEVLLENKNQAILAATRAKELTQNEKEKRIALSHRGAVLLRYADEDGGDRMLDNSFEYEKEFPESEILTRFDFEKDKEKLLTMIRSRQEWVRDIQEKFKNNPIPSYYLEEVFHEPYIAVWRGRDPQMPINYTITSDEFKKELEENYKKGKRFVFDYIALLTLSKLNQLYSIEKYFPDAKISFSLFQKIQEELLRKEDSTLRRLWNFLRKTKSVDIVKNIPTFNLKNGKVSDLFGEWMEDTLKLSKEPDTVLVTDDFVVYRFSKSEDVISINTWHMLQMAFASGDMDKPMYSKSLGSLAECFYTFVGFDGEDLFQIIADDNFKLTARSYHLINQTFLPGANLESFIQVFIPFMKRLWSAGVISQDKVYWLSYITNICTDTTKEVIKLQLDKEVFKEVATGAALIWSVAITSGRKEELELLKKDLDTILKDQSLEMIKPTIIKKIDETIAGISQ